MQAAAKAGKALGKRDLSQGKGEEKENRIIAAEEQLSGGLVAQAWDHLPLLACVTEASTPSLLPLLNPFPIRNPTLPQVPAQIPHGDPGPFIQATTISQPSSGCHQPITPSLHNQTPFSTPLCSKPHLHHEWIYCTFHLLPTSFSPNFKPIQAKPCRQQCCASCYCYLQ